MAEILNHRIIMLERENRKRSPLAIAHPEEIDFLLIDLSCLPCLQHELCCQPLQTSQPNQRQTMVLYGWQNEASTSYRCLCLLQNHIVYLAIDSCGRYFKAKGSFHIEHITRRITRQTWPFVFLKIFLSVNKRPFYAA